MRDRLAAESKAALKSQDKQGLSALRLITAALQQADIAAKATLPDQEIPALLQRMIKQRRELLAIYEKAGRTEQAQQEAAEIAVIEEFLPKQMSEAEAKAAIAAVVKEVGAASPKEMGKVMGLLKERYVGRMDFGKASGQVKEILSGGRGSEASPYDRRPRRVGIIAGRGSPLPAPAGRWCANRAACPPLSRHAAGPRRAPCRAGRPCDCRS